MTEQAYNVPLPSDDALAAMEAYRQTLGDAVQRGAEALGFEDPELREVIVGSIREEQTADYVNLQTAATVRWDELASAQQQAYAEAAAAESSYAQIEAQSQEQLTELERMIERARKLVAEGAREKIDTIAEARRKDILAKGTGKIAAERATHEARLQAIEEAILQTGHAWPVPNLLSSAALTDPLISVKSDMVGLLAESAGEVLDVSSLGEMLSDYDIAPTSGASAVPGAEADPNEQILELLVDPSEVGITSRLAQQGLTIIGGWRLTQLTEGGLRRERIIKIAASDAINDSTYHTISDRVPEGVELEVWSPEMAADEPPDNIFLTVLPPEAPDTTSAPKPRWQTTFETRLQSALHVLGNAGFLNEEYLPLATLRGLTRAGRTGSTFGTETNIQRVHDAGLVGREAMDSNYLFTPVDLVLMYMFNTNRQVLSDSRGKTAKGLIERAVQDYFIQKAAEAERK